MLRGLEEQRKDIIIVANKVDKIKGSQYARQLQKIKDIAGNHKVILILREKKIGVKELKGDFGSIMMLPYE